MNKNLVKTITGVMAATTIISAMAITSNADVATPVVSHAAITQAVAPQVRVAPTPVSGLIDTGTWYNLVYPGQALNGKMIYSLDNCNWSEAIPVAMEAGTYKVYFKVVSNDGAQETEVNFVQITIANPGPRDFVNLMFVKLLNRNADVNSLNNLAHGITFDNKTGADIVYGIISSSEFRNLNLSNEDYVERLYQALAGRSSDPAGKANWVNLLKNGATREEVAARFINAYEFADICVSYGVVSGGTAAPTRTIKASSFVRFFVNRLYTACYNRNADNNGLEYWSSQIANLHMTGTQVAYNVIFNSELSGINMDDAQFITILYKALLGREPEETGLSTWVNYLQSGATRQDVFNQFAATYEFGAICENCGVRR